MPLLHRFLLSSSIVANFCSYFIIIVTTITSEVFSEKAKEELSKNGCCLFVITGTTDTIINTVRLLRWLSRSSAAAVALFEYCLLFCFLAG